MDAIATVPLEAVTKAAVPEKPIPDAKMLTLLNRQFRAVIPAPGNAVTLAHHAPHTRHHNQPLAWVVRATYASGFVATRDGKGGEIREFFAYVDLHPLLGCIKVIEPHDFREAVVRVTLNLRAMLPAEATVEGRPHHNSGFLPSAAK